VRKTKLNKELKLGMMILSLYLFWLIGWLVVQNLIKGSILSPYVPQMDITKELIKPFSESFILGTDLYGRSILEILSMGLLYSVTLSFTVSAMSVIIGVVIGYLSIAGGKKTSFLLDTMTNLVFIFPSILIAILVMSIMGQSLWALMFVLVLTGWPGYARIARGETLRVLALSYVESARAIGVGKIRMFFKVILPDILPQILIHFVLGLSGVIISEAALGFLGLGGSRYSWGALLSEAKVVLLEAPHLTFFVSITMAGLIIGLNLLGDGLRDILDPKNASK
jgi:peptide/nickel transport system permease protein